MANDSKERFSNRVEDYVKYRPGYPVEIITYLQKTYGVSVDKIIADIGAGTGISSELFLTAGYTVIAIEPNQPMRDKGVELLGHFASFTTKDGTAENTGLFAASIDVVIAGQAFHWFDVEKAKAEFIRVLKPGGLTVLLWNERKTESAFEKEYDALIIKHARDYVQVDHRNIDAGHIAGFYAPSPVKLAVFANSQVFNFEGLKGRLLSSSYMPGRTDDGHEAMIHDLQQLFDKHQHHGLITITYDTNVYTGNLQ